MASPVLNREEGLPSGKTLPNAAKKLLIFFVVTAQRWLMCHLVFTRTPRVLLCSAAFQLGSPQCVTVIGVFLAHVQDPAILLV